MKMSKVLSFFKIFKKKKDETNPRVINKSSICILRPKQTDNNGLRAQQNSGFQSRTPQKLFEMVSDLKTSKSQSTRKQVNNERDRRIELVGNYLKVEDKHKAEPIPIRPQRKHSKNSIQLIKSGDTLKQTQKNSFNSKRKTSQMIFSGNHINSSLDSIIEMTGNRVLKTNENLQKTWNQLVTNECKTEDVIRDQREINEIHSKSNSDFDNNFVESELNGFTVSQSDLQFPTEKTENKQKVVNGLVPVRDIDLKTAKCVVCLRLVSKNINLTICSHIFCAQCMREWLRYSQHCPQCRTFISSFGHSIRTQLNRICIRSEKEYKVMRITKNEDKFVDSLGAAYLFEAFLSNREISKYLDSNISNILAKISDLESKLSTKGSVQRNVNIRYRITEQNQRLEEFKQKKRQSEESFKEICGETNPQMLFFWKKVLVLRMDSKLSSV